MTDNNVPDDSRRTVLKGAAATGLAATGLGVFGTSAAAQQNIKNLNVNLTQQGGLLNVNVQNVNLLNNLDIDDVAVTVIGGDVEVLNNIDVNLEDIDVDVAIDDVLQDVLNDSVVQVAVMALSDGDIVAAGSDALNL